MPNVEYWYNDSFTAQSSLKRALGQYATKNEYLYIGLTQQEPKERFRQHQAKWHEGSKWDRMIVIYKARSFELMCRMEDDLINYAEAQVKKGTYKCTLLNDKASQAPFRSPNPDGYWVYCLVQKK